ncbi:hypothetical protein BB559_005380 [Furculomyces boomerangus]|uniref:Protein-serine/threonine kinase n=1 Tax=Furculomyces boomerangus TaxID=61424 RepID=A0A2T9Y917_9FUNG|nr:hypothetical protein BB559_005380 [Furculomyces boomerangus]
MSLEILKNAFRASVEWAIKSQKNGNGSVSEYMFDGSGLKFGDRNKIQPIQITVTKGAGSVCIRIRDCGGGIQPETLARIFEYSFSTYHGDENSHAADDPNSSHHGGISLTSNLMMQNGAGGPIAGLGFGIPMTKVYAEYFGGSLDIISVIGHGCDVFLKLPSIDYNVGNLQI